MTTSRGQKVVLDKRFTIDGKPAKIYNPSTHRTYDFIHQVSTFKRNDLSWGEDKP